MNKINKDPSVMKKLIKKEKQSVTVIPAIPPNSIAPDPNRSLVNARFENNGKLTLFFDDGKRIVTNAIEQVINIEQTVGVKNIYGDFVSTPPQDIAVRFVSANTTITDSDDILIVTQEAIVTLPVTSEKTFRIKRSGPGNVTVMPQLGSTIEYVTDQVMNINLYSIDVHFDGIDNWVVL